MLLGKVGAIGTRLTILMNTAPNIEGHAAVPGVISGHGFKLLLDPYISNEKLTF